MNASLRDAYNDAVAEFERWKSQLDSIAAMVNHTSEILATRQSKAWCVNCDETFDQSLMQSDGNKINCTAWPDGAKLAQVISQCHTCAETAKRLFNSIPVDERATIKRPPAW